MNETSTNEVESSGVVNSISNTESTGAAKGSPTVVSANNYCGYVASSSLGGENVLTCCDREKSLPVCNTVELCNNKRDDCVSIDVNRASDCFELAPLNFVDINIFGTVVTSLIDGGSELNIIRKSKLGNMTVTPVAEVVFRGVVGEGIRAPLIRLPVRVNDDLLSDDDNVTVIFAVCDDLNETCILSVPTVNLLNEVLNKKLMSVDNSDTVSGNDVHIVSTNVNAVVTRSQSLNQQITTHVDGNVSDNNSDGDTVIDNNSDVTFIDVDEPIVNIRSDIGVSNASEFAVEQQNDLTLSSKWKLARQNKADYFVKDGLLFHKLTRFGQLLELLVIPTSRREAVIRMAHADSHFSARRTKERIITSGLFWENIMRDCVKYTAECEQCQLRARNTVFDRVPIKPMVYDTQVFHTMYMDCYGPIQPNVKLKYNYALIVVDSCSRYQFSYPLRSLTAKNVCDALVKMFEITGVPAGMTIVSDNGSNFRSVLT